MGFLNFLKKDKKDKESSGTAIPPPPNSAESDSKINEDLFAPPSHLAPPIDPSIEKDAVAHAQPGEWSKEPSLSPAQEEAVSSEPPQSSPPSSIPGMYEDVPLPPADMQDPQFLDATDDEMPEPFPEEKPQANPFHVEPSPQEMKSAVADIELPDFTDEDFEDADGEEPEEEPHADIVESPTRSFVAKDEDIAPPPEHLPDLPDAEEEVPDDVPPFDVPSQFGKLETAKFLSSNAYFEVDTSIKESRKSMREADNALLDALSYHEHGNEKLQNLAITVNEVQEHLMDLDAALFED